ncbi:MAG: 30S ribosomal protein S6 [Candidatus Komeilibacteria bacterium RIFCSPLOWO2_01_FULL_52_15]|uniref:Small ribosomal subunit protein bS6 n=2 Tax=Candidatus Komeiliibacteriota TaxID=1817908 RepID=A0A1G2BU38_9BACT|nr:MAG: 30S ribosomal protein S6 [Candidatus Komeilibacteria bacterium RIFCSPHIGHO2_01_FULL_52_14]OGY91870.1 MAG: 30S ribosomal protein S6 [Candidatus Komeilibacteria bacterium RIFCSPLOWO2_01_FULL_52_15]
MKHYELLYLVTTQVPETQLEAIQREISDWIEKQGGKITRHEAWGRKKLAYPVAKEKFGYYLLVEFDAEPSTILQLEGQLRLHKQVLRHMLVNKKPISAKELLQQELYMQRHQRRQVEALQRGAGADEKKALEKKEGKISLEELDKKIDELLDSDMIK